MARSQQGQCIRFDPATWQRVQHEAAERGLSVNHFVTRLIAEGLDRLIPADEFTLVRRTLAPVATEADHAR